MRNLSLETIFLVDALTPSWVPRDIARHLTITLFSQFECCCCRRSDGSNMVTRENCRECLDHRQCMSFKWRVLPLDQFYDWSICAQCAQDNHCAFCGRVTCRGQETAEGDRDTLTHCTRCQKACCYDCRWESPFEDLPFVCRECLTL